MKISLQIFSLHRVKDKLNVINGVNCKTFKIKNCLYSD